MPRVRVRDGPNRGNVHILSEKPCIIGREIDCAIQVMDKGASRHHAELFLVGEMCFIRDLGSRNGTYVNDEKVKEELLREGDRIAVGGISLVFEGDAEEDKAREIQFTESRESEVGSTLELRLDDLAGLDEEEDRDRANLRAMYQLGRMLGGERNVESAQEKALAFLAELVPAEQIYLFVKDQETGALAPKARFERDPAAQAQVSRTIIKRCLSETRSLLTTNAMNDARFKSEDSIVIKGIRSVICVPVVSQGEMSGVLYLSSARVKESFVEEDLELATAAGTLLGLTTEGLEAARVQREMFFGAVRTLVGLTELRDPVSRGHSERVASYAEAIARGLGLGERERTAVRLAALLHDVGKAGVAEEALAGRETKRLRRGEPGTAHAMIGAQVAEHIAGAEGVAVAIRHHHEAFDGSGYPDGLAGEAIPLTARIVAAADVLEHLARSAGPGETPVSLGIAVEILNGKAGRQLDPEVVQACSGAFRAGLLTPAESLFGEGPVAQAPAAGLPSGTDAPTMPAGRQGGASVEGLGEEMPPAAGE